MAELHRVRLSDPGLAPLLSGLAAEYLARYGPGDEMAVAGDGEFDPPSGLFLALVEDGEVIAGGGYRYLAPGVCEVKRMWTQPGRRRQGHASAVLHALEEEARAAGYRFLRLETGPAQPEAAALYASRRYRRVPVYGRYPGALAFERVLVEDAASRPPLPAPAPVLTCAPDREAGPVRPERRGRNPHDCG
jgi:GNAT superfamily N-acetyltransferase